MLRRTGEIASNVRAVLGVDECPQESTSILICPTLASTEVPLSKKLMRLWTRCSQFAASAPVSTGDAAIPPAAPPPPSTPLQANLSLKDSVT